MLSGFHCMRPSRKAYTVCGTNVSGHNAPSGVIGIPLHAQSMCYSELPLAATSVNFTKQLVNCIGIGSVRLVAIGIVKPTPRNNNSPVTRCACVISKYYLLSRLTSISISEPEANCDSSPVNVWCGLRLRLAYRDEAFYKYTRDSRPRIRWMRTS